MENRESPQLSVPRVREKVRSGHQRGSTLTSGSSNRLPNCFGEASLTQSLSALRSAELCVRLLREYKKIEQKFCVTIALCADEQYMDEALFVVPEQAGGVSIKTIIS